MIHAQALTIAEKLMDLLAPACKRIEIAGSIRRQKPDVGDIEIVAIPDLRPPRPVFGQPPYKTNLDAVLASLEYPDESGLRLHKILGADKYKKIGVSLDGGNTWIIQLDLFLVTPPAQWGVDFLIRTGPSDFSHWIVTQKCFGGGLPTMYNVKGAAVWKGQEPISTPEEIDFLKLCGLDWIEPQNRSARWVRLPQRVAVQQSVNS